MTAWLHDVRDALLSWPSAAVWRRCGLIYVAFLCCAAPGAWHSGLAHPERAAVPLPVALAIAGTVLLHPAFGEEFLFRVLMLPRRPGLASRWSRTTRFVVALVLYVGAHPLNAWVARPSVLPVFTSPEYLALATLLGTACSLIYMASESIWPSVFFHWLTVSAWILLFGGQRILRV